jgi:GTPase SAR1 family protein
MLAPLNVLVIGAGGEGKTTFINHFNPTQLSETVAQLSFNGRVIKVEVVNGIPAFSVNGEVDAILLFFSCDSVSSLYATQKDYARLKGRYPIVVVGCKCDLITDSEVPDTVVKWVGEEPELRYYAISNTKGVNLNAPFGALMA